MAAALSLPSGAQIMEVFRRAALDRHVRTAGICQGEMAGERLDHPATSRPDSDAFIPDPAIKGCQDRRYNYQKYRYERGHICPAADNK